jgi:O-methyltransferase
VVWLVATKKEDLDIVKVIIMGASGRGMSALCMLGPEHQCVAFFDIDPLYVGKSIAGIPIYSEKPDSPYYKDIRALDYDYIVLANTASAKVKNWLIHEIPVPFTKILDIHHLGILDTRVGTLKYIANEMYERSLGGGGSVAEVGVWKGEFAKYINMIFPDRKLYLFDTFDSFDERDVVLETDENDKEFFALHTNEFKIGSIQTILDKMTHPENIVIRKGWFPESAEGIDDMFCFVNLDTDLYQPTYEGLKFFHDRLIPGGFIMVHDYNNKQGVKKAVRKFSEESGLNYIQIMDNGGSVIFAKGTN